MAVERRMDQLEKEIRRLKGCTPLTKEWIAEHNARVLSDAAKKATTQQPHNKTAKIKRGDSRNPLISGEPCRDRTGNLLIKR